MRKFVMSDIHGHYTAARLLFDHVQLDMSKDSLRFLGDYIDRGQQSAEVIKMVREYERQGAKVQMGNHEQMHIMWAAGLLRDEDYFANGGHTTVASFEEHYSQEDYEEALVWMGGLPFIDEDDDYLYVHAGIHPHSTQPPTRDHCLWIRSEFLQARKEHILEASGGKIVVHGHTPRTRVKHDGARINIDLGAGSGSKLGLIELTKEVCYQIDLNTGAIREKPFETKELIAKR